MLLINKNGDRYWFNKNRDLHRINGPAIEWSSGSKYWYRNDKLHRDNGPAIEWSSGHKEWWINGIKYTEEEFNSVRNI